MLPQEGGLLMSKPDNNTLSGKLAWRLPLLTVILILGCFIGVPAVFFYGKWRLVKEVTPPKNGKSLEAFLETRPRVMEIRQLKVRGENFFLILGNYSTFVFDTSSGPPAYIFNNSGTLVDWTADSGDDPAFEKRWDIFSNRETISAQEALRLVKRPIPSE
jgi:hypothetical protein